MLSDHLTFTKVLIYNSDHDNICLKSDKIKNGSEIFFATDSIFKKFYKPTWDKALIIHIYEELYFIEGVLKYRNSIYSLIEEHPEYLIYKVFYNYHYYYSSSCAKNNTEQDYKSTFSNIREKYRNHMFFTIPQISNWIKDNLTIEGLASLMAKYYHIYCIEILFVGNKLNFQSFIDKYLAEYAK